MNEPPLHERLLRRAEMLIELGYGGCDAELREASAALRPPEGEPAAEKPEPLVIEQSRESLTVGPFSFHDDHGTSFEAIEATVCITVWESHESISFTVNREQAALIHSWFGRWLSHDSD